VSSGFTDKLYWRKPKTLNNSAVYHCFKRVEGGGYRSLCGWWQRTRSGGQAIERPKPTLRCGRCDILEAERRGWKDCAE
jgi:hypothetical protein